MFDMKFNNRLLSIILLLALASVACKAAVSGLSIEASPAAPQTPASIVGSPTKAVPTEPAPPAAVQPIPTITAAPTIASTDEPTDTPPTEAPITPAAAVAPEITARQLAVFEELRGLIQENYLYPDFNGLDFETAAQEYRQRITAGMNEEQFYSLLAEMVHRLGDEHSTFFSPEEAQEKDREFRGQASYVGIGIMTALVSERRILSVLLVFPSSPAEAAGIRAHDAILSVDGQPVVDDSGARLNLLRGPEGTAINVLVQTPGEEPRTLNIVRRAVSSSMPIPTFTFTSPGGRRIGYIYLPTFLEDDIDERVGQALQDLSAQAPLDGLILDNRFNGGGASDVTLNTLSYFTTGQVGYFVRKDGSSVLEVSGQDIGGSQRLPIVVLVGEGTASFGEVFSGILKDLDRAYLIGEVTDGNVEVLRVFDLSDGSRAWIAASTFRPFNDPEQDWEETGIIPDQVVESDWDQVTYETDPAIQSALVHFDSRQPANP